MKRNRGLEALAAVLCLGVVALAGAVLLFEREEEYVPAPNTAASGITGEQLSRSAGARLYFGHMSVGFNILDGVAALYSEKGVAAPALLGVDLGDAVQALPEGGVVLHSEIGVNGDPLGKLANFDAALRSGLAGDVDVAVLKFCYVDVRATTDVEALFAAYSATMEALERDYPEVTFLYTTVPLTVPEPGLKGAVKAVLGRTDNPARERYNALVRAKYSATGRLFDIAATEATAPDGTRSAALYPGYASDGAHLNASGSALVAAELLRLVARVA